MPTGYTQHLLDAKEPMKLRDWALLCARAFGACVTMRDDDLSIPAPKSLKPSTYHAKEIAKARRELKRLTSMSDAQRATYVKRERAKRTKRFQGYINSERTEIARHDAMHDQVEAWNSPPEMTELKAFMLEQIRISRPTGSSYWHDEMERINKTDLHAADVAKAKQDIEYHTKEHAAEVQRTASRNAWLKVLYTSLPKD